MKIINTDISKIINNLSCLIIKDDYNKFQYHPVVYEGIYFINIELKDKEESINFIVEFDENDSRNLNLTNMLTVFGVPDCIPTTKGQYITNNEGGRLYYFRKGSVTHYCYLTLFKLNLLSYDETIIDRLIQLSLKQSIVKKSMLFDIIDENITDIKKIDILKQRGNSYITLLRSKNDRDGMKPGFITVLKQNKKEEVIKCSFLKLVDEASYFDIIEAYGDLGIFSKGKRSFVQIPNGYEGSVYTIYRSRKTDYLEKI